MVAAAVMLPLVAALALLAVASAEESTTTVTLGPGYSAVTWSGAEPYAIANFEGTPVTQIHRRDAVRQKWLSHAVGQDDATLPELHLLPRVQYLLKSDAAHELTIPNPLADIDPLAKLRFPAAPDDPLRFEAYWPNEDSPLEDLVVLRGEDERLSVEAWVEGGTGEVSVWWAIDGRINHEGLESDDVELIPGGHDHGRLYAADETGQVVAVALPRVVRLPELQLPEMTYGILGAFPVVALPKNDDLDWNWKFYLDNWAGAETLLDYISEAGFPVVFFDSFDWFYFEHAGKNRYDEGVLAGWDRLVAMARERDLDIFVTVNRTPLWGSADLRTTGSVLDPQDVADMMGMMAKRWPEVKYWQRRSEPNVGFAHTINGPQAMVEESKAAALGVWYANPDAVVVSPAVTGSISDRFGNSLVDGYDDFTFLQLMYDAGLKDWIDVMGYNWYSCPLDNEELEVWLSVIDEHLQIMADNGDGDKPFWLTETGWSSAGPWHGRALSLLRNSPSLATEDLQAQCIVNMMSALTERDDVMGISIYTIADAVSPVLKDDNFGLLEYVDGVNFTPKPAYWAVREFLTGQPPPEE